MNELVAVEKDANMGDAFAGGIEEQEIARAKLVYVDRCAGPPLFGRRAGKLPVPDFGVQNLGESGAIDAAPGDAAQAIWRAQPWLGSGSPSRRVATG